MSSNAARENMVHKLIAVTGIDDADFARDLLHGNGWQLEPSVNAHRRMMEDTGPCSYRGEGNNEQMQQQQLMWNHQQQLMCFQQQQLMWAQMQTHLMMMQQKQHEEQTRSGASLD